MENQAIDTGDKVRHGPSGEIWIVACVEGEHLSWCGWPEGMAKLSDCELIEKATEECRQYWLNELAKPGWRERANDHRHRYAIYAIMMKENQ